MASRHKSRIPPCYALVVLVLIISALLFLKKHSWIANESLVSDKVFGLLVGFGIVIFGLSVALLRRDSDRVV